MKKIVSSKNTISTAKDRVNQKIAKISGVILGAVQPEKQASLPRVYELSPHTNYKYYASTHYGVMIPDLPEPYRYLSWASVIGYVGFPITDSEFKMSVDGKGDTASLVHGTALSSTEEAFNTYSIKNDIKFSSEPFAINFANQTSMYEEGEGYTLVTNREDLQLQLRLVPTQAMTWFAYSAFYKHFSTLMHYKGFLVQQGKRTEIQGICTLESWKAVATSMLKNQWLVNHFQIPVKIFSYQVINIDQEQQLLLAFICYEDQPVITAVYYRHINGTSIQYNGEIHFEVTKLKHEPQLTPDAYHMDVPDTFRWTAYHNQKLILDINGQVDTPYCYGLAAGFVSSYAWRGVFNGKTLNGRGYLEYIDRR
ncbi:DUF6670 family protein [Acinetobacter sp. NIPH 2699]|uniref:DUF6670 family protein n=1 Tax=Acinetobacter sp. NIPH 2699 TaxID=2923433 RepID=UPI001F4B8DDF|nr:DUF6670 family protein [Acinetobacter sp. NIPH 2699]MCH7336656.1 hypothetical protein [Acinetobacter sp. NIPH 2699]